MLKIMLHKAQEKWLNTYNKLRNQFRIYQHCKLSRFDKQEDLKVLRRSPDFFNNVEIGQG